MIRVKFWGVRGSIATPGSDTVRYGGNTTCIEVYLSSGEHIIFDAGTGIRQLGNHLLQRGKPIKTHLFLSHSHWDHIQGFPFFAPAYIDKNEIIILGSSKASAKLNDTISRQMEQVYFPINFKHLKAMINFVEFQHGTYHVGKARINFIETNHCGGCIGFSISEDDKKVVLLTDNDLGAFVGQYDEHLTTVDDFAAFSENADLLIHDAQYTPDEYNSHIGWGHSNYMQVAELAVKSSAKRTILTHHDPSHTDKDVDTIVNNTRAILTNSECLGAQESLEVII